MTYLPHVSRRQTLVWLIAAIGTPQLPLAFGKAHGIRESLGYGVDPALDRYVAPWTRVLSADELAQVAAFADLVLPGSNGYPAPSALGIPEFIDEWVSAPYETQQRDLPRIRNGLSWLNSYCSTRFGLPWLEASMPVRHALVTEIAQWPPPPEMTEPRLFYCRLRQLVVDAYYTSDTGLKAVGYVGNVPLSEYPPVSGELADMLEARLQSLGL